MHHTHDVPVVKVAVLTLSDSRSEAEDKSGQTIQSLLEEHHQVVRYKLIADDADKLHETVTEWAQAVDIDAIITNGGTGLSKRDITVQTVYPLLDKEMKGFGELFRVKSYEQIGAKALLSNALAGVRENTAIFCLPGSKNAVTFAMEAFILPILSHLAGELRK
ncbi:MogA/MoaB family molybdenum cofactor biosynthesis protein [Shouchella clausii]|jgi:molybdopterin adenylyltransferase|uniref:Molybdenum cofactor biosynthesis protein B n=1 Tax=Shouchella clausii TaxID=79880 RepID=A0A268RWJ9_SHOCL|nr:MogA/MoaB family molybdenum cofactor biosynthesis protein [Shouchella clausii]PAD41653.1 molybdenum cofactor biosynthesis protein [Bacillus sp. 7520-S]SPT81842.1 molybdenum cofactor biosynthesis protein B [Niallia circulans]AST94788.1 molybdenum cofactor biosynthesis protein [Shouchella clausii]MBU8597812.1 MogA/MoaB family molybdenum cofactor biosynthesis protein [Shouchella clausii]MCM3550200.1 MogA/MoaB family molybdenum cofactor biosynthesis protein [Shouchella clausii]